MFIPMPLHFTTLSVSSHPIGSRVRVTDGAPGEFTMGTIIGLGIVCADDDQPWLAVRLDGHTFDYGDGPGIEHRPIDQLAVVA